MHNCSQFQNSEKRSILLHPQSNRPLTESESHKTKIWQFPLNETVIKVPIQKYGIKVYGFGLVWRFFFFFFFFQILQFASFCTKFRANVTLE